MRSSPMGDRQFVGGAGIFVLRMAAIRRSAASGVMRLGDVVVDRFAWSMITVRL